ncbi:hypothetical protein PHLGIDRAFT_104670 [Phlebiopsis gigantea 11061_1 CR5-6]|uniref:Macro domain-containing protein n=1 Tax=Phlebiopsis gigantea (strain 11061_1 CR5-6) TaxID=745531 RepID=A0A0C3PN80_PHLG1|nr:hypothetical protein PHLGIDRAFT_104670 [Phlebiopsis gigantea 11061_1 CR5-6]
MKVALADVPTLRQLYQLKQIVPAATSAAKYKSSGNLLDRVSLYQGTITGLEVDSIVNAANRSLLGACKLNTRALVDGAIHAAAGPELVEECRTLDGCNVGDAKITRGYELPSKHVIHTVGPVYSASGVGRCAELLASCYRRSLEVTAQHNLRHIAFPSISTGVYGYPVEAATLIALEEVRKFMASEDGSKIKRAIFVVWSNQDKEIYEQLIPLYFPLDVKEKEEN